MMVRSSFTEQQKTLSQRIERQRPRSLLRRRLERQLAQAVADELRREVLHNSLRQTFPVTDVDAAFEDTEAVTSTAPSDRLRYWDR